MVKLKGLEMIWAYEQGANFKQIGKYMGFSDTVISTALKTFGVPIRSKSDNATQRLTQDQADEVFNKINRRYRC